MRRQVLHVFVFAALALVALVIPASAAATPPPNDDFANLSVIDPSSLPFSSGAIKIGKVNFQTVATIVGARDALPTDNTATSPPTMVKR